MPRDMLCVDMKPSPLLLSFIHAFNVYLMSFHAYNEYLYSKYTHLCENDKKIECNGTLESNIFCGTIHTICTKICQNE